MTPFGTRRDPKRTPKARKQTLQRKQARTLKYLPDSKLRSKLR